MIEKATSHAHIASMLQTLRSHQAEASQTLGNSAAGELQTPAKTQFGQLVGNALSEVSQLQNQAQDLQTRYEQGEDLPLADVVLGMQKSSLAFEATLQIRNKVLKAYEDILNMPV